MAEPVPARQKRLLNKFGSPKRIPNKKQKLSSGIFEPSKGDKNSDDKTLKKKSKENMDSTAEDNTGDAVIGFIPVPKKLQSNAVSKDILLQSQNTNAGIVNDVGSDEENEKRIEENEQFIIELLSKTQPHHDHSYTTIFGKRKNTDYIWTMLKNMGEEYDVEKINPNTVLNSSVKKGVTLYCTENKHSSKKPTPILFLRHRSPDENVPMVSKEEIIDDKDVGSSEEDPVTDELDLDNTLSRGEKPYPPMPKSSLAKRGRLGFDLSDISDGSDEEKSMKKVAVNPLSREGREGNLGWEPKLAIKHIRELKGRKKGDHIPLKCKICNDKTFTAAATLLYHYRSHAGFKPFVCLICNTTFTRQHSLNYHMLIHNNQSRFTCKDCGRKFRHPSHFKEHLRRHTGETPFECKDCGQKFKTRNTYKRHLRTRHGKLLTAAGIHNMPADEFEKLSTKRHSVHRMPLPDISYKMPELTFTRLRNKVAGLFEGKESENLDSSVDECMILEELKQDIKKEADSEQDGDPELATVLEALSQSGNHMDTEKVDNGGDSSKPVPASLFMNHHTYQAKVNEIRKTETIML